jgi:anaerobic selenocysteine-containing dehydrogenase
MNAPTFPVRSVTGVCPHDCPDSCGWVVTVEDRPGGPVPVKLRGNPEHPYSLGELCPKVNRFLERALSPDRVLTPMRRTGPKGSSSFAPVTWSEALREIAERWRSIIAEDGAEAIAPYWDAGNQSALSMGFPDRFVTAMGMSRIEGSVCGAVAGAGTALTYGSGHADDPTELRFAKTVVLWGTNTRLTNRHLWPSVEEAKANGATVVIVDPIRTMTAEVADVFIQPLPGTDVAMILAIMHVLIRDGLIDHEFIRAHTTGFEELSAHVESWKPQRAAEISGVTAEEIESLARLYGTNRPSFVRTLIGAEHAEQGATFFRALSMLPVLIGAWRERGGGFARSVGIYTGDALASLSRAELRPAGAPPRALQANHIGRWLTDGSLVPQVRSLLVWNANPAVTIPNSALIRRGLARDDLFTVVHEQFLTDTASYADIVLPACTQIELDDVMPSWGSPHLTFNHRAIPPLGESVSNTELFRRLARAMGFSHPALLASDAELIDELFAEQRPFADGITADRLRAEGTVRLPVPDRVYADGGFRTADGKALLASPEAERLGLGRVPDVIVGHETVGGDSDLAARYPLMLATPKVHTRFLNSSYSHLPGHGDREDGPYLELCPADAEALGLGDGDAAEVWNDRARLRLPVKVSGRLRPGLVAVPFGWGAPAHGDGHSANSLTNDTITNWGGGVAYNDTRVAVRRAP